MLIGAVDISHSFRLIGSHIICTQKGTNQHLFKKVFKICEIDDPTKTKLGKPYEETKTALLVYKNGIKLLNQALICISIENADRINTDARMKHEDIGQKC